MNLCEMNREQLLMEYLHLASRAFQAKTASLQEFHRHYISQGCPMEHYELGKRLECEYERISKTINLINTLLHSKGVDTEFLEEIRF